MPDGRGGRDNPRTLRDSSPRVRTLAIVPCFMALAVCVACSSGCANRGGLLGGPSTGQLKTSLAHVELENQQLHKQVAQLKTDNRSIEDRLVKEELNNGDLTARLDNARNLLKGRGVELEEKRQTASTNSRRSAFDDDELDDLESSGSGSRQTLPAGRKSSKRKPPFARIPGRIEQVPADDEDSDSVSSRRPTWSTGGQKTSKSASRQPTGDPAIDEHTAREDQLQWTSIGDLNTKAQGQTTKR